MAHSRRRGASLLRISFLLALVVSLAAAVWWSGHAAPREVALESGWNATARVIAGDGVTGSRDGRAGRARFSDPFGVAVAADGTVYVADAGDAQRIRRIAPDGTVSTVAGGTLGFADGPAAVARFDTPSGLAIDSRGALYVADTGNNAIRRVTPEGTVSTLAGDGIAGYQDGPGHQARFNGPIGVAIDATGRVIVADSYNDRIRAIDTNGTVTTLAGGGEPGDFDGIGSLARFDTPSGVAIDATGTILVADTGNGLVRMVSPAGAVSTRATPIDGMVRPVGIAVSSTGNIYVTDDRGRIVEMSPAGAARTVAGSTPGFRDGSDGAQFRRPAGIAVAAPGRLIVADAGNALVRLVAATSRINHGPPSSPLIAPRFDAEAFASQPLLWPVAPIGGPHEIAGTIGEARGESAERFHAGIDVRVEQGTPVTAIRSGVVASPIAASDFGSLNESLGIGALSYVHLRVGRELNGTVLDPARFVPTYDADGKLVRMRVKRGARFATGEMIGTVNAFNHVHVNIGWPGAELNPLQFDFVQFEDTVPPTIRRGGVRLYDKGGQPLTRRAKGRLLVSGQVQIVVDAWDQVDGNARRRRLGPYAFGYQVLNRDGSTVPGFETARDTIRFDQLTSDPAAARLVYAPGSGIPFYRGGITRFLYVVSNTFRDGVAAPGFWDTTILPRGDYTLRVRVADIRGNEAVSNRDVPVTVAGLASLEQ